MIKSITHFLIIFFIFQQLKGIVLKGKFSSGTEFEIIF